ncbi:MAG: TRAP transporter large permease [Sphaerochaeta sp.]|jgi:tripartite ATP-independent transporter DctM subunit|uniref:TRAP transporter large permease n=2 Tax=unclassified Sphaerochaeta TaxID=2637943 RepID=UPI00260EA9A5|nr:TRAP transporter large permease [Sphaerochaeta sp.]MCK9600403.1 TRAP transporter large permease [Sphaerochaeta sp.]MDX9825662.1 TRAP transporter large permease [Sphaerochaeta sp.]
MTNGVLILFGSLIILMMLRFPISFALGIASLFTATYLGIPYFNLFQKMATGITSFTFMCVPFFIIMAQIMTDGGISDRLTKFSNVLIGRVRGGTALVNCVVSMFFGGISGSSIADVSSIGSFLIPSMIKEGYDADYSIAVTCTSSVEGVIIPPSQNMIFYVVAAGSGLSISTMFMTGYLPGFLLTGALMLCSYIIAVRKKYPISEKKSWKENIVIIREALLGLVTILIVAVGIVAGVFTATEAGAIAAVYAFIVTTFFYKTMNMRKLMGCLLKSLKTLGTIMAIIATSSAFSYCLAYLRVPTMVANGLLSISSSPAVGMLLMIIMMVILGCFMDMGILLILLTPILYPVAMSFGFNPYHFGLIMVLTLGLGLLTPPVGTSLWAGCAIAHMPIEKVIKGFLPFYLTYLTVLILIVVFPNIALALPMSLGYAV